MDHSEIFQKLVEYLIPYQPEKVSVFGSYARGDQRPQSDLDVLVKFSAPVSFLKLVKIEQQLSDLLGVKVELLTDNSLRNPKLRKYVYEHLIVLYPNEK